MRRGLAETTSRVETSRGLEREKATRLLLPVVSRIWDAAPPGQASDASHDPEMVYAAGMNWLLIMAALACNPGDRLLDKIPRGLNSIDLVVTVEPFYALLHLPAGLP